MKNILLKFQLLVLVAGMLMVSSCDVDPVFDQDNPSLASLTSDPDKAQLQVLVTGLEARHRNFYGSATQMFGSFGREVWAYFGSDPRFISHWLGVGVSDTYNDFFASNGTYLTPYVAVKQANVLLAAANSSTRLTAEERAGYTGFAKTIKGFQLLWPLLQQYQNGIRIDVEDPLNPGPIVGYDEALQAIRDILDDGYSDLQKAGSSFAFTLTSGWAGFDDPAGMAKVNRAIAARAALYANEFEAAKTACEQSFMDLNVDAASSDKMWTGPQLVYGESPDINNPLFYVYDQPTNTILICHPAWVEDALPGDARLNKVIERVNNPVTNPGLKDATTGDLLEGRYQDNRWATNTSPIPFIRNEELILIYAEAQLMTGSAGDAVNTINIVRNTWGVGDYTGGTSQDELIEEILFQRRYSLWAEAGHRWIDLRRTGKLDAAHVDLRDGGVLFQQVAPRTSEINWDNP
ncbi:MAG: RagB/SusD family nutrient uptake outer membrane protein [Saprospirales bacterium]|nr:RagB/SusD family nutrient uptake outer membrane protein [Saprospirales bacterium]